MPTIAIRYNRRTQHEFIKEVSHDEYLQLSQVSDHDLAEYIRYNPDQGLICDEERITDFTVTLLEE